MSFHFLDGNTYGPYSDTGPGSIIVDPLATVEATGSDETLSLASGPWTVAVNGSVNSEGGYALQFSDTSALMSNLTVGAEGSIYASNGIAVTALHPVNITNGGQISGANRGVEEIGNGDYTIKNLKGAVIEGGISYGIAAEGAGIHTIINAGLIASDNNDSING